MRLRARWLTRFFPLSTTLVRAPRPLTTLEANPIGAETTVPVLAAVITRGARYLVCQRAHSKRHGGLWEFPGGKVEAGETLLDAAHRELTEELNVRATRVGEPLFSVHDDGSPFVINFVPTEIDGEPVCLEHADLRWATLNEIRQLDLAPSDRDFVDFLVLGRS